MKFPVQSICPANRALSAPVLDTYTGKKTFGTLTLEACQKPGFLTSEKPCGVKLPSLNGPVPTGVGSTKVAGLPALLQTACGTMAVPAIDCRLVNCGGGKLGTTVLPDERPLEIFRPLGLIVALFFTRL